MGEKKCWQKAAHLFLRNDRRLLSPIFLCHRIDKSEGQAFLITSAFWNRHFLVATSADAKSNPPYSLGLDNLNQKFQNAWFIFHFSVNAGNIWTERNDLYLIGLCKGPDFFEVLTFNSITLATHFLFWSIWVGTQRCTVLPHYWVTYIDHISWKPAGTEVRIFDIDAQTSVAHTTIVFARLYPFSQAQTAILVRFGIRGNTIPELKEYQNFTLLEFSLFALWFFWI